MDLQGVLLGLLLLLLYLHALFPGNHKVVVMNGINYGRGPRDDGTGRGKKGWGRTVGMNVLHGS